MEAEVMTNYIFRFFFFLSQAELSDFLKGESFLSNYHNGLLATEVLVVCGIRKIR